MKRYLKRRDRYRRIDPPHPHNPFEKGGLATRGNHRHRSMNAVYKNDPGRERTTMPKKNGTAKLFSFDEKTIAQMSELADYHKLNQTALLEYLLNKEYREKIDTERRA